MNEVYIPTFWLEASSERLVNLTGRIQYDLEDGSLTEEYINLRLGQLKWLEQQIPIAKARELLLGETND